MAREDVLRELDEFARQKSPVARDAPTPPPKEEGGRWSRSDKMFAVVTVTSVAAVAVSVAALAAGQAVAVASRRRARRR